MRIAIVPTTLLAALLAALALAAPVAAAPTDPDTLFDLDGIYLGATQIGDRGVVDTKIDSEGRIVLLTSIGAPSDIRVERLNSDGTPDDTFDDDGVSIIGHPNPDFFDHGNALYINSDDSILIAANVRTDLGSANSEFGLIKLKEDGDPDNTFGGGDGNVLLPVGFGDYAYPYAIDVQSDGKIVLGGTADGDLENNNPDDDFDWALARFTSTGSVDTTFGFQNDATPGDPDDRLGWITQSIEPRPNEEITGLWAQDDGTILAAGRTQQDIDSFFALARFSNTGFVDLTFATGGHTTVPPITDFADIPHDATVQADGKIVIAGETLWDTLLSGRSDTDFAVARLNTDGSIDDTFAGDGTLAVDFSLAHDIANGVATDECGRIVVAGSTGDGFNADNAADQFAVARVWPDGTLDTTFDGDGRYTDAVGMLDDQATSIAIQPADNKIVVAGISMNIPSTQSGVPAVERLLGGGDCTQPDPPVDPPVDPPANPPASPLPPQPPITTAAKITSPKQNRTHRAKRLLKLRGTATGSDIAEIQVALRRETGGRCVWMKSSKGQQRRSRKRGDCAKTTWLKATGTTAWSYSFKRKLPKGSYRLYVRAKLAGGGYASDFVSGESAVKFKIR